MMRRCSRCGHEKALTNFPRASRPKASNGGFEGVCKACVADKTSGRTKRCRDCHKWKPAEEFRIGTNGNRENYCIPCRVEYTRTRRVGERTPTGDSRSKLPDYDTLKHLLFDKGMSYGQIAEKYGLSSRIAVYRTVKQRALRRGEWPLMDPHESELRRRRGRERSQQPGEFWVRRDVLAGLLEEYLTVEDLSPEKFAHRAGLRPAYVKRLLGRIAGASPMVLPAYAVRVMDAMGEPVPAWLRQLARLGSQPPAVPTPVPDADEAAWQPGPVADAEEHVG